MADQLSARVRDVLIEALSTSDVDLEEVEVRSAGRRRLVRVSVDTDGGIGLDEVAAVTRVVSDALDSTDVMGDAPYTLEVGSPGVSRPLTLPRHWRRNIGRLVRVVPADGSAPFEGRVVGVADSEPADVTVETDHGQVRITQPEIDRAVVQVELNRGE